METPCRKCGKVEENLDGLCSRCRINGYYNVDFVQIDNVLGNSKLITRVATSNMFLTISSIRQKNGSEKLLSSVIIYMTNTDDLIEAIKKVKEKKLVFNEKTNTYE